MHFRKNSLITRVTVLGFFLLSSLAIVIFKWRTSSMLRLCQYDMASLIITFCQVWIKSSSNEDVALSRRVPVCSQKCRRAAGLARLALESAGGSRISARLPERLSWRRSVPRDDRTGVHVCLRAYALLQ